jgi:DNA-binding NtrC family response regulator
MSTAPMPAGDIAPGAARQPLLLVEDDAPLRQMLRWDLSDLGYDIGAAAGCTEARRLAAQQPFRFALIDVRLPDGDGRDLAAELQARLPGLRVVLMSGDERARSGPAVTGGVLAFIAKPVDIGIPHRLFTAAL